MTVSNGFVCLDTSPTGPSVAPAPDSRRTAGGVSEASPSTAKGRRAADMLLFEVTDASIVRNGASKYVVSGNSRERTPSRSTFVISVGIYFQSQAAKIAQLQVTETPEKDKKRLKTTRCAALIGGCG